MDELKVLFVHDHIFHQDQRGLFYSGGGLPCSVWSRYKKHFSHLTVIGRRASKALATNDISAYALSSAPQVDFHLLDNISGITSRLKNMATVREHVENLVRSHDAVIARLTSELGLLAITEARKQGKPWAVELVDCPWDALWGYGSLTAKLYAPILRWRVRSTMAKSSHALYVTKEFLQDRYPCGEAVTIGCSNVEIPSLSEEVLAARLARIQSLSLNRKLVFGLLGSLNGRLKGIHTVLQALSGLLHVLPPFEFRVLGGGDSVPWREEATRLGLADIVFFDGVLPSGRAVYEWLDKIDIYLHPSFKEGLPRALIEAMSRGCPAIASNVAGTPELLSKEFLISPGDVDGLADKINQLFRSTDTLAQAANDNFFRADSYSTDKLNKKRDEFWRSFAEHCRKDKQI